MGTAQLKVKLLAMTPDPDKLTALAARMCYSGQDIETLLDRVDKEDQGAFLEGVMGRGHLSVAEHASFSFLIEGVSRALLAQLTRHRIASFSVQSQRYVSMEKTFDYVIPPSIMALGEEACRRYEAQMEQMHAWYCEWQAALGGKGQSSNEDARFVLPNAAATRLVVTMNARELSHFFSLRCCGRAQWEIREMAWQMLECCRRAAPVLFSKAGPACLNGPCPEGKNSCGQAEKMRARVAKIGEK